MNYFEQFLETPGKPRLTKAPRTTTIEKRGNAIVIPENLTYGAAANALAARAEAEEQPLERVMKYECHPNDGYVAITSLISDTFGYATAKSEFFNNAAMQRIATGIGDGEFIEAFSGGVIGIPTLPDIQIRVGGDVGQLLFFVQIVAKEKHSNAVNAFLTELGKRIRENSIYQGKAFDSRFNYLDLRTASTTPLILPEKTRKQVEANLFTPLRWRERLHEIGTPFGRSILLEGPYGTGKTLLAFVAGREATDNGITFIYVRQEDHAMLPLYLRYARRYAPAVLFYEDIDLLVGEDDSERNDDVNLVLNTLDGIDSKGGNAEEVMVVMTTNNVDKINEALMRPGRIDAVIHVGLPDAVAAGELIAQYGLGSLEGTFNFQEAGVACDGMTPAFIREIVERAKLVSLSRNPAAPLLNVSTGDVLQAADEIKDHLKLASPRVKQYSTGDRLVGALEEVMDKSVRNVTGPLAETYAEYEHGAAKPGDAPTALPVAPSNGHAN